MGRTQQPAPPVVAAATATRRRQLRYTSPPAASPDAVGGIARGRARSWRQFHSMNRDPQAEPEKRVADQTADEQPRAFRAVGAEETVAHGGEHQQPWQDARRPSKRYTNSQAVRPSVLADDRDKERRQHGSDRIVDGQREQQFVVRRRRSSDVSMKRLQSCDRREPSADEIGRQRRNEPQPL